MNVGTEIKFGPFQWIVLEVKQEEILIISKDMVGQDDYHNASTIITWENSSIRDYLNNQFIKEFTNEERKHILKTRISNKNNSWYLSDAGNDTDDFIWLLSLDEVVRLYFGDSSKILDNPSKNQRYWFQSNDSNNDLRRSTYLEKSWWWWTRTPGKNQKTAVYIHGDGNVGIQGNGVGPRKVKEAHPISGSTKGGIRPAMWIKYEKGVHNNEPI